MICCVFLVGVFALAAANDGVSAAENPAVSTAAWSITRWTRCDSARPNEGEKSVDAVSAKYLHVELAPNPTRNELRLHQFKIVDQHGRVVAEAYGFHRERAIVVFEGDWWRLEGLWLDGAGHREPLLRPRLPARDQQDANAESRPPMAETRPKDGVSVRPPRPMGSVLAESAVPPRKEKRDHIKSAALPTKDKRYQEVRVSQSSRMNIEGLDFKTELEYRVLSALEVEKQEADGAISVVQRVEQADVLRADPLTQGILRDLLGKLVGTTFRIALDSDRRVTSFEGATSEIRAAVGNQLLGGQAVQMISIIDPDGWREIAEITFFRPPAPAEKNRRWERRITHGWGPLGNWTGNVVFSLVESREPVERYSYEMKLVHQPPDKTKTALPFQILRADFAHEQAGGTIVVDRVKQQTVEAKERFPVKGQLTVGLLGQELNVGIEELQEFHIRVTDCKPVIEGQPER